MADATGPVRVRVEWPFEREVDGAQLLRAAVRFGRELRSAGLGGDLAAAIDFARVLSLIDIGERDEVRAAGATLFVRRRDDIAVYDQVFDRFWRARLGLRPNDGPLPARRRPAAGSLDAPEVPETPGRSSDRRSALSLASGSEPSGDRPADGSTAHQLAYSTGEVIRHQQFDRMSSAELREAERLIELLEPNLEVRRTRRQELHPHGRLVAPRAMFRRNLGTGGEVLEWVWRRSVRRPRSIVVLCDISGSMERQSRLFLRFVHAIARTQARTDAFVFGTRLTRVTRQLRDRDVDRAMRRIGETASDWSGGTRIGEAFREFNLRWARRVLRTSGVVIVMSDGWDRGDPAIVAAEAARLRRNCHRLIWLNPLAGAAGYQPLAAGMAAAYPFIDDFLAAGSIANLERLGELLAGESRGRGRTVPRRLRRDHRLPAEEAAAGRRATTATEAHSPPASLPRGLSPSPSTTPRALT